MHERFLTKDQILDLWPPQEETHTKEYPGEGREKVVVSTVFMVSRRDPDGEMLFAINRDYYTANTGRPLPEATQPVQVDSLQKPDNNSQLTGNN